MEIRYLSVSEAALLTGYDRKTVYTALRAGDLDGVGKPVRIPESSLRQWATSRVRYARKEK